jgi:hypothetical protein
MQIKSPEATRSSGRMAAQRSWVRATLATAPARINDLHKIGCVLAPKHEPMDHEHNSKHGRERRRLPGSLSSLPSASVSKPPSLSPDWTSAATTAPDRRSNDKKFCDIPIHAQQQPRSDNDRSVAHPSAPCGRYQPPMTAVPAVSMLVAIGYGIAVWSLLLGPAIVLWLKGRSDLVLIGLCTLGLVWLVGLTRIAKPDSRWARRFYGPDKLAKARARYR